MKDLMSELKNILDKYNQTINNAFEKYWKESIRREAFDENTFCNLFCAPRNLLKNYRDEKGLHCSTIAGTILEWTLYHFLNTGLSTHSKTAIAVVRHRHQIPYKWKKKGNKKVNIDVVIKSKKTKKLYYAFEVKTNFEDGFEKYLKEEKIIYHHRTKPFKDFKYYYLSLDVPPPATARRFKRGLKRIQKRKELYVINTVRNDYSGAEDFLKSIDSAIKNLR